MTESVESAEDEFSGDDGDVMVNQSKARMKHGWSVQIELLCVMLVSAIVLIPGLGIPGLGGLPVIDRDEARFAQASRQMMESNSLDGWIVPRVGEKLRLNKPPVIYWLQAGVTTAITGGDSSKDG